MLALISSDIEHFNLLKQRLDELAFDCHCDHYNSISEFVEKEKYNEYDHLFIFCPSDREICYEIKGLVLTLDPTINVVLVSDDPESIDFKSASEAGINVILSDSFPKHRLFTLFTDKRKELIKNKQTLQDYWSLLQDYTRELRCVLDDSGRILYANPACDIVVGYTQKELNGRQIFDFVNSRNLFGLFRKLKSISLMDKESHVIEFKHKNGQIIFLNVQFHKLKHDNVLGSVVFFAQDVSKLISIQKRLYVSNERWEILANNTSMNIIITDQDLNIQYVNKLSQYAKDQGLTKECFIGKNFREFSTEESMKEFLSFLVKVRKRGYGHNYIARIPYNNSVYDIAASHMDLEGEIKGYLFIMNDITEQYEISETLKRSEARNKLLFQNNISGAIRVNQDGIVLECNHAMQEILGLNNASVLDGENITSIMTEELWEEIQNAIEKGLKLENREINFSYNNNKFWLLLNATIINVSSQTIVEISVKDISSLKEVIFQLKKQTDRSNKYQSMLLSSQLNPHFIFNALNSMQYYILHENIEEGLEFVSDFSSLIRMVLQNSSHSLISIEEEVEFLNKYLIVEKHRMQGKLDYTINIDDKLNLSLQTIPPMLIQPYVENTIVHGFTHKNGKGNVSLKFELQGDTIVCEIDDDGVGREKAYEMRKNYTKDFKKSMSMSINQNRLDLLEKQFGKKFNVSVRDKYDNNNNALGTIVRLEFPMKE